MISDSSFTVIIGGEEPSEKTSEPDGALGPQLLNGFCF